MVSNQREAMRAIQRRLDNPKLYCVRLDDKREVEFFGDKLQEHEGSLYIWRLIPTNNNPDLSSVSHYDRLIFRAQPGGWLSYSVHDAVSEE